jgi:hypothetical protein
MACIYLTSVMREVSFASFAKRKAPMVLQHSYASVAHSKILAHSCHMIMHQY